MTALSPRIGPPVTSLPVPQRPALRDWEAWLDERAETSWRPKEWHPDTLMFIGSPENHPHTRIRVCTVPGCGLWTTEGDFCRTCDKMLREPGMTPEKLALSGARQRNRRFQTVVRCSVPDCQRDRTTQDLCMPHYQGWHKVRDRPDADLARWLTTQRPLDQLPRCRVKGCPMEHTAKTGLCRRHKWVWRAHARRFPGINPGDPTALNAWAEKQPPFLFAHMFSLAPLEPLARREVLHALAERDKAGYSLNPQYVRSAVSLLSDADTLAFGDTLSDIIGERITRDAGVLTFLRQIRWALSQAADDFRGIDPTRKLVWDLRAVSRLNPNLAVSPERRNAGSVDFTKIRVDWLRDLAMHWGRTTHPDSHALRRAHLACVIAGDALHLRPGGGQDPSELHYSDMTAVVHGFEKAERQDGQGLLSAKSQGHLLSAFVELLDFGRLEDTPPNLSAKFVRHRHHKIARVEVNEDEIGKALPDAVIRQLDASAHMIGAGFPYGGYPREVVRAMFRTAYVLLRDTGRRPLEIAGLDLDCLEFDNGEYQLIWHNFKGKRLRRRLPIPTTTVDAIKEWKAIRATLGVPPISAKFLFPHKTARHAHLETNTVAIAMRAWVDDLPELTGEEIGPDGNPMPFDRTRIYPYAFRHTFCQRYADAGVPAHVLQALMDHRSSDTTGAYYRVSNKMKRQAMDVLRLHSTDRNGAAAPLASATAYDLRAVAVPFGNCIEPSNIKAGGQACPVRFQCSTCPSYRPDPSHLPAIEDQVRSLSANLETARAMGVADYTIRGLEGEIADYKAVVIKMQTKLESMSAAERTEVEEASRVLRRLRAGTPPPGPVPLPMPALRAEAAAQR